MDINNNLPGQQPTKEARDVILKGIEVVGFKEFYASLSTGHITNDLTDAQRQALADISAAMHIRRRAEKIYDEESGKDANTPEKSHSIIVLELRAILEQMDFERARGNASWQSKLADIAYKAVSHQLF